MNVQNYVAKKEKGLAEMISVGGGIAVAFKKFDPETGSQVAPEIQAISIEDLEKIKKQIEASLNDINEMIADINSLNQVNE